MTRNKSAKIALLALAPVCIAVLALNVVPALKVIPLPSRSRPFTPAPKVQVVEMPVQFNAKPKAVARPLDVEIDPNTPLADLLPPPPKNVSSPDNRLVDDPRLVPEVRMQDPLSSKMTSERATKEIATQLAKIRQANLTKTDGFLQTLIEHRDDMRGLPFAMGENCRTPRERAGKLASLSSSVRVCLTAATDQKKGSLAGKFWTTFAPNRQGPVFLVTYGAPLLEQDEWDAACVATLTQVLAPESAAMRLGLVQYLSKVSHIEATKALAKLALFSEEKEVRAAAIHALKVRREKDYLPLLLEGFHYPLPQVAKCAAEALVGLGCEGQARRLVDLLEEPDPRLPVTTETNGTKVTQVREVVRLNHHRNCMLCHAPADVDSSKADSAVTSDATPVPGPPPPTQPTSIFAQVPFPNQPLPSFSSNGGGYGSGGFSGNRIMVRFDVTYLRQDFSLYMPVENAAPWPDMQRFDFLVRTRVLSPKEAEEYQQNAPKPVAGATTPYQRAILFALRELTQRDTAPTPEAWRELLALPAKKG